MKLNDNSQRYKDARQIMSEKLADSRKESAAEKAKRLKEVCSQCAYWTSENSSYGTCDYIGYEGHQRPCSGTKCVETEVFKPLDEKKRRRNDLTLKHIRTNDHLFMS